MSSILGLLGHWPFVAAAIAGLGFVFWRVHTAGKRSAEAKQLRERMAAKATADRIELEVAAEHPDDKREELRQWSPKS
jgi:hypothetical protein